MLLLGLAGCVVAAWITYVSLERHATHTGDNRSSLVLGGFGDSPWTPGAEASSPTFFSVPSLSSAASTARFQILSPSPAVAQTSAPPTALLVEHRTDDRSGAAADVVVLVYPHLEINEDDSNPAYDPATQWSLMAAQHTDPGDSVGTVLGRPAYIAPEYTDAAGVRHPGYIEVLVNGVVVTVEGYFSTAALTGVGDSLTPVSGQAP